MFNSVDFPCSMFVMNGSVAWGMETLTYKNNQYYRSLVIDVLSSESVTLSIVSFFVYVYEPGGAKWVMLWIGCQLNDFIRRSWLRDAWRRLFMPVVPNRPMSDQALALWLLGMCSIFLKWNCLEYGAVLFWLDWVGNKRSFITPIDRLILTHWEFRMCWRHCLSFCLPLYACACVVCE